jgi:hypothetical protein
MTDGNDGEMVEFLRRAAESCCGDLPAPTPVAPGREGGRGRDVMRRLHLAGAALVVIAVVCMSAAPASAMSRPPNSFVSGAFSGTALLNSAPDCSGQHVNHEWVYGDRKPPPSSGAVAIDSCVDTSGPQPWAIAATFVLTARNGATLSGTLEGLVRSVPGGFAFDDVFTVTRGTQQFTRVTGTIEVSATATGGPLLAVAGTFNPHLTFSRGFQRTAAR